MLPSASVLAVLRQELGARAPSPASVAVLADPVFSSDDPRIAEAAKVRRANPAKAGEVVASARPNGATPKSPAGAAPQIAAARLTDVERSARESGIDFKRLRFSRQEAEAVAAFVPEGRRLKALDFEASLPTVLNSDLSRYGVIHFATHALVNNQRPELSGIILSLVDEQGRPREGFLRLHEIYNLNLKADLVVLSACQTALGKEVRGEGLMGLARGFMYAGSPRVVASLWHVDDRATAELMKRFYHNTLSRGLRPAAALREAQVSMSKEKRWESPRYWAGFVLQGEW